jgi:ribonuclease HII
MAWLVGLDEAGYGPNLGPFVMSAVCCRVPDEFADGCLWKLLRKAVRRSDDEDDGRLVIDDSKLVYSSTGGLAALEAGVLAALPGLASAAHLEEGLGRLCPSALAPLRAEAWFTGTTRLPVEADRAVCEKAADSLGTAATECGLTWGMVRSEVVCAGPFNDLLDATDSKGNVLGHCLAELVRAIHEAQPDQEATFYFVDKHGGRNYYAALVQNALPQGMVSVVKESATESTYRVHGLGHDVRLTFLPRADTAHLCVALASMVSKYLRELLMGEFNAFWAKHVVNLKPTAGYPGDAARFYRAIRPTADRLGISERVLWRRK